MEYDLKYSTNGQLTAVYALYDGIWMPLPLNVEKKTFDEKDYRVIDLREWEKENGKLNLGDRPPDPIPQKIGYRLNSILPSDRLIESDRFPSDINYNTDLTIGLTTKTIDYFGLRVAQVFYQSVDPNTRELIPAIPVVFERYKYTWDANTKLPLGRVKEIYFYKDDNTLSEQFKLLPKEFYNVSDRADICTKRRQTILTWLIARATEINLKEYVETFFATHKDATDKFVLYGDRKILEILKAATDRWLDIDTKTQLGTIRNSILVSFTKALEPTGDGEVDQFLSSNK